VIFPTFHEVEIAKKIENDPKRAREYGFTKDKSLGYAEVVKSITDATSDFLKKNDQSNAIDNRGWLSSIGDQWKSGMERMTGELSEMNRVNQLNLKIARGELDIKNRQYVYSGFGNQEDNGLLRDEKRGLWYKDTSGALSREEVTRLKIEGSIGGILTEIKKEIAQAGMSQDERGVYQRRVDVMRLLKNAADITKPDERLIYDEMMSKFDEMARRLETARGTARANQILEKQDQDLSLARKMLNIRPSKRDAYKAGFSAEQAVLDAGGAEEVAEATRKAVQKNQELLDVFGDIKEIGDSIGAAFSSSFDQMITGAKSAGDAFKQLGKDIVEILYKKIVLDTITDLITNTVTTGLESVFPKGKKPAYSSNGPLPESAYKKSIAPPPDLFVSKISSDFTTKQFATGGIVDVPSIFPLNGGAGIMAERGPEAIMPLRRGPDGRLGVELHGGASGNKNNGRPVPVDITIVNESGEQVKAEGATGKFDGEKMVVNIVLKDLSNNGKISKAIKGIK